MLSDIAYMNFAGLPILYWTGIAALVFALAAASKAVPSLAAKMPLKRHRFFALISIGLALLHAVMALAIKFGF